MIFDGATTAAGHESGASAPQSDIRVRATSFTIVEIIRLVRAQRRASRRHDDRHDEAGDGAHLRLMGPSRAGPQGARLEVLQAVSSQSFILLLIWSPAVKLFL